MSSSPSAGPTGGPSLGGGPTGVEELQVDVSSGGGSSGGVQWGSSVVETHL